MGRDKLPAPHLKAIFMSKQENKPAADGVKLIAKNRQAFHKYEILQKLECGLALAGTEVKSLREGHVAFADSFAAVLDGELVLYNLNISEYSMGNRFNHVTTRRRKLLAHKAEIRKLKAAVEQRGLTLVPLEMYWRRGMAKVQIGVARGKQLHDKRETLRDRDRQREQQRAVRSYSKG